MWELGVCVSIILTGWCVVQLNKCYRWLAEGLHNLSRRVENLEKYPNTGCGGGAGGGGGGPGTTFTGIFPVQGTMGGPLKEWGANVVYSGQKNKWSVECLTCSDRVPYTTTEAIPDFCPSCETRWRPI